MDGSVQKVTKALPYAHPVTTLQRGTNLLAKAGYPANMFFFRGVLLKGYKKTYDTVREDVTPVIMKKLGR